MTTIKSYTDLEQSKKLAEILPIKSADMCYKCLGEDPYDIVMRPYTDWKEEYKGLLIRGDANVIPCWSLAALIKVLPSIEGFKPVIDLDINQICYEGKYRDKLVVDNENLIDACYEMIIRLNELNLL